jgi:hypothetical protein
MGNAYPAAGNSKPYLSAPSACGDTSLIEENARLRALVVQLSNLVLRNVVDQHNTPGSLPVRRVRPD